LNKRTFEQMNVEVRSVQTHRPQTSDFQTSDFFPYLNPQIPIL